MLKGYRESSMSIWDGRIDDGEEYDSFRWHQYIKPLDLGSDIEYNNDKLAFVLIGYELDEGILANKGKVGAKFGSRHIRKNLCNKPCSFSQELKIYDGGNVSFVDNVESSQETLAIIVEKCIKNNYFPIVIGGGHDLSYGSLKGIINTLNDDDNFGMITFDAHFDFRKSDISTSGSMFYQIYEDMKKKNINYNYLAIGIQKSANTVRLFKRADQYNAKYILSQDLSREKIKLNEYIIDSFMEDLDKVYVCVCMDVFASAFAPGVSSPQPMGIYPETFLVLLKHLMKNKKMIAFDVAETSPGLDQTSNTAGLAALIIYSLVNFYGEIYL
ncbi:MAG: formimidoylglutamase [Bacilli bacterium]|nr:formimidoylglutamase [Bacilli bacterium]